MTPTAIPVASGGVGSQARRQRAGSTVFAPFKRDTDCFGQSQQMWMLNFRVDAMTEQLRTAGIEVTADPQTYPNGRSARLYDPEGNPIELWQPNPAE
ncbi:hypothetical protein ASD02_27015 [Ensifer sp. Root1252]|jgi:hypothetical protein|nr:VOC family protein [Ensifer sp. Root31]KQW60194.1 hypothetical protein ASD02_27015 [Ensifer sp. Root1252]KQW70208.1 hypothetical protein ASD03_33295 [Ensifer sp. Root127]KQY73448.1 hypothetical protein ASD52_26665 [Ensifer sp. Root142]KRC75959.1 hypothetical protein ASE32_30690 [Ensifer sp. Root231]KRC97278.1 hypothetical protein ASE47_29190 [Ensifer sp. Root258]MDP9633364.1 hypothetical protein [Ensifer adhaerens]OMQ42482.1 hypothetical protein BKP54_23030 [Ensifer sp. 1H6]PSS60898.1 gl